MKMADPQTPEQLQLNTMTLVPPETTLVQLKFGFWNVNPDNQATAVKKKKFISEGLNSMNCDIVALQELPVVPENFMENVLNMNNQRDYSIVYNGNSKNAAIYYDKNTIIKISQHEIYDKDEANEDCLNVRFCIGIFRLKQLNEEEMESASKKLRFIFVSVHNPIKGGTDSDRSDNILELITYMSDISPDEIIPFIICGDFNVRLKKVKEHYKNYFKPLKDIEDDDKDDAANNKNIKENSESKDNIKYGKDNKADNHNKDNEDDDNVLCIKFPHNVEMFQKGTDTIDYYIQSDHGTLEEVSIENSMSDQSITQEMHSAYKGKHKPYKATMDFIP